jgi:HK97 family phage prohead protease
MKRAYSLLEIKAVDDEQRLITGIASTPTADRMGDVVDPKGAQFNLPIPLLWQHDSNCPIGQVTAAKVTKNGIEITAQIAKNVTQSIEDAWALIKSGLVRGLSIGFRSLDSENIPNSWGVIFKAWEWLELSCVTIAANAEASIQTIKSIDTRQLAASGKSADRVVRLSLPCAAGKSEAGIVRLSQPQTGKPK